MTFCTAVIGVFEALLFSMLGHIVDWLTRIEPARLWADERGTLLLLAGVLFASPRWWRCKRCSSTRRWRETSRCGCAGIFTG